MTRDELYQKLETAQELLGEVYHFALMAQLKSLTQQMSVADTMICESYEEIECGDTAEFFKDNS